MSDEAGTLCISEQVIPVPKSLSPQAQAFLAGMIARVTAEAAPNNAADREALAAARFAPAAARFSGSFSEIPLGHGAMLYRATPENLTGRRAKVALVEIHGGGFISGGGEMCRMAAKIRAADMGAQVYTIDYRLAPQHPYPAALDDCVAAYREVLNHADPKDIVIAGTSAGGNLAAALLLRARAAGLPLPAGLLLMTPAVDMTASGDSRTTNRQLDVSLYGSAGEGPSSYVGDSNPRDPFLSPLFAEIGTDWPPTLLTTGTRDLLLSDTVLMHRKLREAGADAQLLVSEAGLHIGLMSESPEDKFIASECRKFVRRAWNIAA